MQSAWPHLERLCLMGITWRINILADALGDEVCIPSELLKQVIIYTLLYVFKPCMEYFALVCKVRVALKHVSVLRETHCIPGQRILN